jgi:hypothetical protein
MNFDTSPEVAQRNFHVEVWFENEKEWKKF